MKRLNAVFTAFAALTFNHIAWRQLEGGDALGASISFVVSIVSLLAFTYDMKRLLIMSNDRE